ncbi:MAG: hypothetical protein HKO93_03415, partial [Flavobacteriales bacterium]|nr:hypothetical protein [Flavobacteriales bacterium]
MKRIITSVLSLMFIGAVVAQERCVVQELDNTYQVKEADLVVKKPTNGYPKVLDLFEETFSNGYDGDNAVGAWTPSSTTAVDGEIWKIATMDGTPPTFNAFGPLALTSETSSNGYAWCDLFGYNQPLLPDWEDITATLTTPELDFTDNNSIILEFTQRIAYCCFSFSPITIDVSNDGGNTWVSFPAEGEFIPDANANSGNITTQVDISCAAAGQSSVFVRFGYDTDGFGGFGFYSWSIDDVLIFETETVNDLSISQTVNGDVFNIFEYRVTPIQQAIPEGDGGLLAGAMFSNKGSADQTNCTLTAEILDAGGSVVSTTVTDPFDLPANGNSLACPTTEDTIYMQTGWVPEETGDYTLRMTLASDQTDDMPDDNVVDKTIVYTGCMFGHDDEGVLDIEWRASADTDNPGSFENTGYGNIYTVHNEGSIGIGALVRLGPNCDSEFEAEVRTYEYDPATQSVNDASFLSTFYEIAPEDIPESEEESFNIFIEFDDEVQLEPGSFYFVAIVNDNITPEELSVMAQTNSDTDFSSRRIARSGAGDFIWFSETATPAVRLIIDESDCFTTGPSAINELEELSVDLGQNNPNPVSGLATIQYTMEEALELRFELRDSRGRIVMEENLGRVAPGQHFMELDVSDFKSGLYH